MPQISRRNEKPQVPCTLTLLFLQCLITSPDRNRSSTYEEIKMKPGPTLTSFERSLRHLSHYDGEEQWSNVWTEGDGSTQCSGGTVATLRPPGGYSVYKIN